MIWCVFLLALYGMYISVIMKVNNGTVKQVIIFKFIPLLLSVVTLIYVFDELGII